MEGDQPDTSMEENIDTNNDNVEMNEDNQPTENMNGEDDQQIHTADNGGEGLDDEEGGGGDGGITDNLLGNRNSQDPISSRRHRGSRIEVDDALKYLDKVSININK